MKMPSAADQFVKVQAGLTDEGFGYDRWMADQFSGGRFARPAVLVLCQNAREQAEALGYLTARAQEKIGTGAGRIA